MKQSSFVEITRMLTANEKAQILNFASNPYFNNGRFKTQNLLLLEICFTTDWNNAEETLDKKLIFSLLFPNQEYVEGKVEKVMVDAHKIVRNFLLFQKYFSSENDFNQSFDYAEIIRKKGLHGRFQQIIQKLDKQQNDSNCKDIVHIGRQFNLEYAKYEDECFRNQTRGDLNIPGALKSLETHYLLYRLTILNYYLLQQKVANIAVPTTINIQIDLNTIPNDIIESTPILSINLEIYKLLKNDQPLPSDVSMFFKTLQTYEDKLDHESLRQFYTYLRNICVLVAKDFFDDEAIRITLFELYKDNLIRGYLHFEGKLHASTYLAVSFAAVRVKQLDWAINFIEKYKAEVMGENETRDLYRFNLALYFFGAGRYTECLDNIPDTSPFVDYLLQGKRLELRALYELQSDLLSYKLDAFKMFLSRTSQKLISESQRQTHTDFANLLHQLINSMPGDPKRSDQLTKRIQDRKQAAEWRWLLEKAKALKNG